MSGWTSRSENCDFLTEKMISVPRFGFGGIQLLFLRLLDVGRVSNVQPPLSLSLGQRQNLNTMGENSLNFHFFPSLLDGKGVSLPPDGSCEHPPSLPRRSLFGRHVAGGRSRLGEGGDERGCCFFKRKMIPVPQFHFVVDV